MAVLVYFGRTPDNQKGPAFNQAVRIGLDYIDLKNLQITCAHLFLMVKENNEILSPIRTN
jgi:hypothetical protein